MKSEGKFRKKPVVIFAKQFFKDMRAEEYPAGVYLAEHLTEDRWCPSILTLEGRMEVKDGDYVITGVAGEVYPCRRDIFEQTYEEVDDE